MVLTVQGYWWILDSWELAVKEFKDSKELSEAQLNEFDTLVPKLRETFSNFADKKYFSDFRTVTNKVPAIKYITLALQELIIDGKITFRLNGVLNFY